MFMIDQQARELQSRGHFHGFGAGPDIAWTVASFSLPELSSSCYNTLCSDLIIFFTPEFCTSLDTGSYLELSVVFLSIMHTLLKQLKVSFPTGFLKSNPAIVISWTHRSYSDSYHTTQCTTRSQTGFQFSFVDITNLHESFQSLDSSSDPGIKDKLLLSTYYLV